MMRLSVDRPRHLPVTFVFLSVVAAVGMQLLQPQLWPAWTYALIGLAGTLSILFWLLWRWPSWVLLTGVAALVFGSTGWRASHYASSILLCRDVTSWRRAKSPTCRNGCQTACALPLP